MYILHFQCGQSIIARPRLNYDLKNMRHNGALDVATARSLALQPPDLDRAAGQHRTCDLRPSTKDAPTPLSAAIGAP